MKKGPSHRSFGSIADSIESIVKPVWTGVRSVLGKEASASTATFATPASFACVENNSSVVHPDEPVSHPTLGFRGIRTRVQQPYLDFIQPTLYNNSSIRSHLGTQNSVVAASGALPPLVSTPAGVSAFNWALNPVLLGGALAQKAKLYDRYVFRGITFEYTTTTTTTEKGSITMAVENDIGRLAANDFSTLRMVVPSVTFPARIPQARLNYVYNGPELYYTLDSVNTSGPFTAQQRQQVQGVFGAGFAGGGIPTAETMNILGFVMVYVDIEFYDPIPPVVLPPAQELLLSGIRSSLRERQIAKTPTSFAVHAAAVEKEVSLLTDKLFALSELTDEEALSPDFTLGDGSVSSASSRITLTPPDLPPGPAIPAAPVRKGGFW